MGFGIRPRKRSPSPSNAVEGCSAKAAPCSDTLTLSASLRDKALVWLEGFFFQIGVELSQLARVGEIILVRRPGVFALHLERFIQRLGTEQIFHRLGAALERTLRVIRDLGRDRLRGLCGAFKRVHRRIHVGVARLLHVIKSFQHRNLSLSFRPSLCDGTMSVWVDFVRSLLRARRNTYAAAKSLIKANFSN